MITRKSWENYTSSERQRSQVFSSASSSPQLSAALCLGSTSSSMSGTPFVNTSHGHPSFNPIKIGSRNTPMNDGRMSKPPKPPDKPLMPYMRYSRKGFQSPQKGNEGKASIQGIEEDEDPEEFSVKHVSASRYFRNHVLINEIFSDAVVPDVRSVVTTTRMQVLKRQVQSLTNHQKKLEDELEQIQEKFEAKKRKFVEASDAFQEEIRKRCAIKPVDSTTFQKMVDKALEQIKVEHALKEEQAEKRKEEEQKQFTDSVAIENNLNNAVPPSALLEGSGSVSSEDGIPLVTQELPSSHENSLEEIKPEQHQVSTAELQQNHENEQKQLNETVSEPVLNENNATNQLPPTIALETSETVPPPPVSLITSEPPCSKLSEEKLLDDIHPNRDLIDEQEGKSIEVGQNKLNDATFESTSNENSNIPLPENSAAVLENKLEFPSEITADSDGVPPIAPEPYSDNPLPTQPQE